MCLISYEAVHDAAAQKHQITSGVWSLQVSGVISKPPVGQLWFSSGTSMVADEQIQCGKSVGVDSLPEKPSSSPRMSATTNLFERTTVYCQGLNESNGEGDMDRSVFG
jgi:hypothetical protein